MTPLMATATVGVVLICAGIAICAVIGGARAEKKADHLERMCELMSRGLVVKIGDEFHLTPAGLRVQRENDAEDLRREWAS
jgi:hypothetical protein